MSKNLFMKICLVAICAAALLLLFSCGTSESAMEREAKKEAIYNRGYEAGKEEGKFEAQDAFEQTAQDLAWDTRILYGIEPEEAMWILTNYADGEPVSKKELNDAIWAIHHYYCEMQEAIDDIDSYID